MVSALNDLDYSYLGQTEIPLILILSGIENEAENFMYNAKQKNPQISLITSRKINRRDARPIKLLCC